MLEASAEILSLPFSRGGGSVGNRFVARALGLNLAMPGVAADIKCHRSMTALLRGLMKRSMKDN